MIRSLLAPLQFQKILVRNMTRQQPNKKHIYKRTAGNGKKFEKVVYYEKDDFQPPQDLPEPPKLFRVQRFAPVKHRIYWEKKILADFGLIYDMKDIAIVKNTPENNVLLWKIKHLVSVEPIVFPYGEPTEADINYTKLKEDGQCIVQKEIGHNEKSFELAEQFSNDPKKLDKDTLKREALLKWVRHY